MTPNPTVYTHAIRRFIHWRGSQGAPDDGDDGNDGDIRESGEMMEAILR